ncbi:5'-3' exoribonuclease 2 [Gurleya vavrai]
MGVPSLFIHLSHKYPSILTSPHQCTILLLDFNALIHNANRNIKKESDLFNNLEILINNLISHSKVREIVYIAVDGVAPRAKMNQQRARRYASADETVKSGKRFFIENIEEKKEAIKKSIEIFDYILNKNENDKDIEKDIDIEKEVFNEKDIKLININEKEDNLINKKDIDLINKKEDNLINSLRNENEKNNYSDSLDDELSDLLHEDIFENVFDSNSITPGTPFMERLESFVEDLITKKMKNEWKHLKIIFNGSKIPGEGEQKILEFLRKLPACNNYKDLYNNNTNNYNNYGTYKNNNTTNNYASYNNYANHKNNETYKNNTYIYFNNQPNKNNLNNSHNNHANNNYFNNQPNKNNANNLNNYHTNNNYFNNQFNKNNANNSNNNHANNNYFNNNANNNKNIYNTSIKNKTKNYFMSNISIYSPDADFLFLALPLKDFNIHIVKEEMPRYKCRNCNLKGHYTQACSDLSKTIYLNISINELRNKLVLDISKDLQFSFEKERIINDFILVCFFCGNDFLPSLNCFNVKFDAIEILKNLLVKFYIKKRKYLTKNLEINFENLNLFLRMLSENEDLLYKRKSDGIRNERQKFGTVGREEIDLCCEEGKMFYYKNKLFYEEENENIEEIYNHIEDKDKSNIGNETKEINNDKDDKGKLNIGNDSINNEKKNFFDKEKSKKSNKTKEINNHIEDKSNIGNETKEIKEEKNFFDKEKSNISNEINRIEDSNLKKNKINNEDSNIKKSFFKFVDEISIFDNDIDNFLEKRKNVAQEYLKGLQWTFSLYFGELKSWSWFYPYHYAPFASDLLLINNFSPVFKKENNLEILQQAVFVLPPLSRENVPVSLHKLYEIKKYFPSKIKIDMFDKLLPWQGIVLLPFIEIEKLLGVYVVLKKNLKIEEIYRNTEGFVLVYSSEKIDYFYGELGEWCYANDENVNVYYYK